MEEQSLLAALWEGNVTEEESTFLPEVLSSVLSTDPAPNLQPEPHKITRGRHYRRIIMRQILLEIRYSKFQAAL